MLDSDARGLRFIFIVLITPAAAAESEDYIIIIIITTTATTRIYVFNTRIFVAFHIFIRVLPG